MSESELLKEIGIKKEGTISKNGNYVVDIDTYDEYGKYFSLLEKSEEVEEIPDTSLITNDVTDVQYQSSDYIITLQANLNTDEYKIVVKARGKGEEIEEEDDTEEKTEN